MRLTIGGVLAAAAVGAAVAADDKNSGLEEIVVTAERRSENLQDVPLSITAFGSEKRDIVGIQSIQDMANFAPGVSYNTSTDRPSIRGIARQSNFFTLDSPVANYFDGVYTSSVQDAQRRPIFIDRTEILRGPQGALSGRGSIAGAINTISKMPADSFGGEARGFYGNFERYGVETTVTGPFTSWLRGRINLGHYRQNEGYFENIATGRTEGDQPNNRDIVDGLLTANFGEAVDVFLKVAIADYDESRRTGYSTAPYVAGILGTPSAYGPSSSVLTPLASFGYFSAGATQVGTQHENPVITTGDVRKFANDYPSRQKLDDHHNITSHVTWHAPALDIKWISGHQNYKYRQWTDLDGTDVLTMRLPAPPVPGGVSRTVSPGGVNFYGEERKWWSNELTFTSTRQGSFSWIFGLYQSTEKYNQEPATSTFPGYAELNNPIGTVDRLLQLLGQPFNAASAARTIVPNPRPFTSVVGLIDGKTTSSAGFGQVDYQLTDAWKFTVGLRYNKDEKEATESERAIANGLGNGLGPFLAGGGLGGVPRSVDVTPVPIPGAPLPAGIVADRGIDPVTGYRVRDMKHEWSALTGSVGVDFKPTDADLVYLRVAKGYRPGGFNAGFIFDPPMVDEEKVISYEVGYKTTLFDRLQLSTSVFYYDYRDIQLPLPTLGRCTDPNDLSTCTTLNSFINLPKAKSQGVEIEATWAATDSLSFFLSYGYLDAKIKQGLANGNGFSNPDDPAAILPSAHPYQLLVTRNTDPLCGTGGTHLACILPQTDAGFTNLPRYTQNLSGNSMANSPKNRVAFNTNYTFNFTPGKLTLSGSYVWRDESFSDVFETEVSKVPSYATVGARLLWTDASDRYTVILYGNNLTDEEASDGASVTRLRTGIGSAAAPSAAGAAYYRNINLAPPREYGLELQYRFGSAAR